MEICSSNSAIRKDIMVAWLVKEIRDSEDEDKGMDSKEIFEINYTQFGDWLNMGMERDVKKGCCRVSGLGNGMVSVPCPQANTGPLIMAGESGERNKWGWRDEGKGTGSTTQLPFYNAGCMLLPH